jgi:GntR family transcriptional regulator
MGAPKYERIAESLREQITSGQLMPGKRLPTENQLCDAHGASRSTIRLAIGLLVQDGLVETLHGLGTFVAPPSERLTIVLSQHEDWRAGEPADAALRPSGEMAARPRTVKFQADTIAASPAVAEALNIRNGDSVVLRRSHRFLEQEPWSLVVSYYPLHIANDTPLEQARPVESASLVLANLGHEPIAYSDDVYARMSDTVESQFFKSKAALPVIVASRTTFDAAGPVRLTRYVYRADRVQLRHDTRRVTAS